VNLKKSRKIKLLETAFGEGSLEASEENFHLCCPVCNDLRKSKKKLYVSLATGWYNCWVCNTSGKNINFLFRKHAPQYSLQCQELFPSSAIVSHESLEEKIIVELPRDAVLVSDESKDPDTRAVFRYLKARGMSRLDMYRWRVCVSQQFYFRRKAIFPSFDDAGILNYYVARSIDETKFKYNNAKVPKSRIIFNEIDLDWKEPIIVVEGVFDAVKCPDNTAIALGSTLSKDSALFKKLSQHQCTVIIAFDEDAETKSHKVCKKLYRAGCSVYKVTVRENDLGSRSSADVENILKTAESWSQISLLSHKISSIKSGSVL